MKEFFKEINKYIYDINCVPNLWIKYYKIYNIQKTYYNIT